MRTIFKSILILFISVNVMTLFSMFNSSIKTHEKNDFSDEEKEVINKCRYNTLVAISGTSRRNYQCIHDWIDKKAQNFFNVTKKKFHDARSIEEKVTTLEKSLRLIQGRYIQRRISVVLYCLFNQNPNISVIKIAVRSANECIKQELESNVDSYTKERYATIFWQFLESITKNRHISKKDKEEIFSLVDKKVQNFPYKKSIRSLLHQKKRFPRLHDLLAILRIG